MYSCLYQPFHKTNRHRQTETERDRQTETETDMWKGLVETTVHMCIDMSFFPFSLPPPHSLSPLNDCSR